ncbi:MAG: DUF4157 domain-containing protein [Gammaproteobacteria bacterium]
MTTDSPVEGVAPAGHNHRAAIAEDPTRSSVRSGNRPGEAIGGSRSWRNLAMALALASRSRNTKAVLGSRPARRSRVLAPLGIRARPEGRAFVSSPALGARPATPRIQTKLEVGAPNDRFEQEAERVAEQVMRMPGRETRATTPAPAGSAPRSVQRMCNECAKEETALQRAPLPDASAPLRISALNGSIVARADSPDQTPFLQRQDLDEDEMLQTETAVGAAPDTRPGVAAGIRALRGRGQPLSAAERAFFEPRFGHDFGQVRLHTDARAAATARAVNARAFTVGRDVVFGAGEYTPETAVGRQLLAHELVHTIQQQATDQPTVQRSMQRGQADWFDPDNCWEKHSTKEATDRVIGRFVGILDVPRTCEGMIEMTVRFEVIGGWSLDFWLDGSTAPLLFTPTAYGIDAAALIKGKKTADDSSFQYDVSYPLTSASCAVNFDLYMLVTFRKGGQTPNFAEVKFSPAIRSPQEQGTQTLVDESPAPTVRVDSCGRLQPTPLGLPGGPAPLPREPDM